MKNLMATAAVVGLLMTGTSYAAQTTLSDKQMDTVTAGTYTMPCDKTCVVIHVPPNFPPQKSSSAAITSAFVTPSK